MCICLLPWACQGLHCDRRCMRVPICRVLHTARGSCSPPFAPWLTLQEYNDDRDDVIKTLQNFGAAPFTLQRLCEILVEPTKHYTSKEKLLFAINKQTSVSSTLEPQPFPFEDAAAPQGRRV